MKYTLSIDPTEMPVQEIITWLHVNIGKRPDIWSWYWSENYKESSYMSNLNFKYEEDKIKFILRWL